MRVGAHLVRRVLLHSHGAIIGIREQVLALAALGGVVVYQIIHSLPRRLIRLHFIFVGVTVGIVSCEHFFGALDDASDIARATRPRVVVRRRQ